MTASWFAREFVNGTECYVPLQLPSSLFTVHCSDEKLRQAPLYLSGLTINNRDYCWIRSHSSLICQDNVQEPELSCPMGSQARLGTRHEALFRQLLNTYLTSNEKITWLGNSFVWLPCLPRLKATVDGNDPFGDL